jgi:uncharacterized protein YqfA (UPF0365 family)
MVVVSAAVTPMTRMRWGADVSPERLWALARLGAASAATVVCIPMASVTRSAMSVGVEGRRIGMLSLVAARRRRFTPLSRVIEPVRLPSTAGLVRDVPRLAAHSI